MLKRFADDEDACRFDISPNGPIINESTCLNMRIHAGSFLKSIIMRYDIQCIVSLQRKGTWIIDDVLSTSMRNECIKHIPFSNDLNAVLDQRVLIFDDSINTGASTSHVIDFVLKTCTQVITVASLAINQKALSLLESKYGRRISFEFMNVFDSYIDKDVFGKLRPCCQSYYFATSVLPYVRSLNSNVTPDFHSWFISLSNVPDIDELISTLRNCFKSIGGEFNDNEYPVPYNAAYRMTFDMPLESPTADQSIIIRGSSKVRVSIIPLNFEIRIVITPIMMPELQNRSETDSKSISEYYKDLSSKFIADHRKEIMDELAPFSPKD